MVTMEESESERDREIERDRETQRQKERQRERERGVCYLDTNKTYLHIGVVVCVLVDVTVQRGARGR